MLSKKEIVQRWVASLKARRNPETRRMSQTSSSAKRSKIIDNARHTKTKTFSKIR